MLGMDPVDETGAQLSELSQCNQNKVTSSMLVQSLWAGASQMPPSSDFDWTWAAAVGRREPAAKETGWW